MGRPPYLLLDPSGTLHYCKSTDALRGLAKSLNIKLFNLQLQVDFEDENGNKTVGNTKDPEHVKGWTGFGNLKWLKHAPTGRIVFVHGRRGEWVDRANASNGDWAKNITFTKVNFGRFMRDNFNGGKPYLQWELLKVAPIDAEARVPHVMTSGDYCKPPAALASTAEHAAAEPAAAEPAALVAALAAASLVPVLLAPAPPDLRCRWRIS